MRKTARRAMTKPEPMVPDHVDADSVAGIVSEWTGIPVGRLMQGENEKLLQHGGLPRQARDRPEGSDRER